MKSFYGKNVKIFSGKLKQLRKSVLVIRGVSKIRVQTSNAYRTHSIDKPLAALDR